MTSKKPLSKKRKFVKDGVFYAELNDFLSKELAECGYAGCEVRVTPNVTEVIIRATKTMGVVGEKGQKIRELTALVTKRFKFKPGSLQLVAEKVKNRGLSALAQAEAVRYRLFEGLSVRRACYSVLKFIKERGAKGCEVIISGKLRGQRAKSMKFREGYMLHAGDAVNYYIDEAVKHLHLKQGVLGIKVKIMLPYDPTGKTGVPKELPDVVVVHDPKEEPALGQSDRADQQAAILQDVVHESLRKDYRRDAQGDSGDGRFGQSDRRGGFEDRRGGFDDRRGGFEDRRGGFEDRRGGFEDRRGGFEDRRGGFGDRRGGFGDRRGGFGDRRGGFGDRRGGFGQSDRRGGSGQGYPRGSRFQQPPQNYQESDQGQGAGQQAQGDPQFQQEQDQSGGFPSYQ